MKLIFLGTGTSQGVPVIACNCAICCSQNPKDQRLRTSVLIQDEDQTIVIDSGPDFRQQLLREKVQSLDAVLFTHEHKDHIAGLDDVRAFNYRYDKAMNVYCTDAVETALRREFNYVFENQHYPGVPKIQLHKINEQTFPLGCWAVTPLPVMHLKLPVLGFRIGALSYVTDANYMSSETKEKIKGSQILILNALRNEKHPSHFTLEEAIDLANELEVPQVYFTHISHQLGLHDDVQSKLPPHMHLAYDGLTLNF
jgi:phosphoribosyl 1,2-cyclic phosphate phosphodiesterase